VVYDYDEDSYSLQEVITDLDLQFQKMTNNNDLLVRDIKIVYDNADLYKEKQIFLIHTNDSQNLMSEIYHNEEGKLIIRRVYGRNVIDNQKIKDIIVDQKYLYIFASNNFLYVIKHGIPLAFSEQYYKYDFSEDFKVISMQFDSDLEAINLV
jgi:hypothetical protein